VKGKDRLLITHQRKSFTDLVFAKDNDPVRVNARCLWGFIHDDESDLCYLVNDSFISILKSSHGA
jgi:hypothetical protein